jgi:hypothetical protein
MTLIVLTAATIGEEDCRFRVEAIPLPHGTRMLFCELVGGFILDSRPLWLAIYLRVVPVTALFNPLPVWQHAEPVQLMRSDPWMVCRIILDVLDGFLGSYVITVSIMIHVHGFFWRQAK